MKRLLIALCVPALVAACGDDEVLKKANNGDPAAQFQIGERHKAKNEHVDAAKWFRASAEKGYAPAQYKVGEVHVEAAEGYRSAAEQGIATAIKFFKNDYSKAVGWFEKAAQQGHGPAQYKMAEAYIKGWGVDPDLPKATEWAEKAAAQGIPEAKTLAEDIKAGKVKAEVSDFDKAAAERSRLQPFR